MKSLEESTLYTPIISLAEATCSFNPKESGLWI